MQLTRTLFFLLLHFFYTLLVAVFRELSNFWQLQHCTVGPVAPGVQPFLDVR
jgi:hypothetical protein